MSETQQIGIGNLQEALSRYTRQVIISNWMVASGSDLSTIVPAYVNPAAATIDVTGQTATDLVGARIEFIDGANVGSIRELTGVQDNGTMSLDSPLPNAPSAGDHFVLLQGPRINVNVTAPKDIKTVNGTVQTAADWTALFQTMADAHTPTTVANVAHGTAAAATTAVLTNSYAVPSNGTLNISIAIEKAGTATTFSMTTDGANYYDFNSGNDLNAGALYSFSIPVLKGDTVNFEFGAATTIGRLEAFFVPGQ